MATLRTFSTSVKVSYAKPATSPAIRPDSVKLSGSFLAGSSKRFSGLEHRNFSARNASFSCRSHASPSEDRLTARVQELHLFEINERDRDSPIYLKLSQKSTKTLGDLVCFTNKLYTGDMQKRVGLTGGICNMIESKPVGDRYEAAYGFHLGDYGHISAQGPYLTYEDTYLAVTGGSGIFVGVYGEVRLHQIVFPLKLYYTFYLRGIGDLPDELVVRPIEPTPDVEPSPDAKACKPHATISGYTH